MKRVGRVVRTVGGVVVAQSPDEFHPAIGTELVDETLTPIGRVVDVIGPVDRPYIVVSPGDRRPASLLNERLYLR